MKRLKENPRYVKFKFNYAYSRLKKSTATRSTKKCLNWGLYQFIVMENCRIQSYVIKSFNLLLTRLCKGILTYKFSVHFRIALTVKSGMRMGTGKGKLKNWVAEYRKGDVFVSFSAFPANEVKRRKLLRLMFLKFPCPLKLIKSTR